MWVEEGDIGTAAKVCTVFGSGQQSIISNPVNCDFTAKTGGDQEPAVGAERTDPGMGAFDSNMLNHRKLTGFLIDSQNRNGIIAIEQIVQIFSVIGNTEALSAVGRSSLRQTIYFVDECQCSVFGIAEGGDHHFAVGAVFVIDKEERFGGMESTVSLSIIYTALLKKLNNQSSVLVYQLCQNFSNGHLS